MLVPATEVAHNAQAKHLGAFEGRLDPRLLIPGSHHHVVLDVARSTAFSVGVVIAHRSHLQNPLASMYPGLFTLKELQGVSDLDPLEMQSHLHSLGAVLIDAVEEDDYHLQRFAAVQSLNSDER